MKERPILFSGPMVRAILEGRKTQTRRVIKPQPLDPHIDYGAYYKEKPGEWNHPYGQPGDRLWVRETHAFEKYLHQDLVYYKADADKFDQDTIARWRPSIHMPRWASRITLEIVSVRVERLNDISEEDSVDEGVERTSGYWRNYNDAEIGVCGVIGASGSFKSLWESINGPGSWQQNPWVWVIEFKKVGGNV